MAFSNAIIEQVAAEPASRYPAALFAELQTRLRNPRMISERFFDPESEHIQIEKSECRVQMGL
jgi:hypothetical protein